MAQKITEFLEDRRQTLVKSAIAQDEAEHQALGTPRRFAVDGRDKLVKAAHLFLDENAPENNSVSDLVKMFKSSDGDAPQFSDKALLRDLSSFWDESVLVEKMLQKGGVRHLHDSKWFTGKLGNLAKRLERNGCEDLAKIMVTGTSGSGLDWVPEGFSADYWGYVDSKGKIYNQFQQINMPWPTYSPPYFGGRVTFYKAPQASENFPQTATSAIPQTKPTTGRFTLTAVKIAAMIPLSDEFQQDSIVPVIPAIKNDSMEALALARDQAILDGDTSADHMDSDVDNATGTDVRLCFPGLRWYAKQRGAVVDLSTFSIANLRKIVKNMGRYGENLGDLFWVSGVKTRASILGLIPNIYNAPQYVNVQMVAGGEPQINLDFMPVMVTSRQREDLNSSGVKDLTNTGYGTVLAVNKRAFTVGVRKEVETELWRDPRTQTWYLIIFERKAFGTPYTDTTNDLACMWGGGFQP